MSTREDERLDQDGAADQAIATDTGPTATAADPTIATDTAKGEAIATAAPSTGPGSAAAPAVGASPRAAASARPPLPIVGPGGHAAAVDPAIREAVGKRLKRIEGQVRGLQRMVEEERYCADILMQIASVHEALRGVGKLLMRNHLEHCVTDALRSGDGQQAERAYDEVLDLMYRHAR